MSHGLPDVTLQSTRHEVIVHDLREVTSERQVISHDPFVTSIVLMAQNGKKCIYNKTFVDLCFGRHVVFCNNRHYHIDLRSALVNMTFTARGGGGGGGGGGYSDIFTHT